MPSALKKEDPALQNMKFSYFFLFLWVIFALLDPRFSRPNQYGSMRIRMQNIVPNLRAISKAVKCKVNLHVRGVKGLVVDVWDEGAPVQVTGRAFFTAVGVPAATSFKQLYNT
jgi:hypothetical protein